MKTSIYELVHIRRVPATLLAIIAIATFTATMRAQTASSAAGHAAHSSGNAMPADANKPDLAQQLSDAQAKAAQLQGTLVQSSPRAGASPMAGMSPSPAASGGMQGMDEEKMMMGKMDQMMQKMDKMMPMMERMMGGMGMGGGMSSGAGMGMDRMGSMGGGSMSGGGGPGMMDEDKMEMSGMMGMGAMGSSAAIADSALPGFPGASHLYHIGATGFFLDHPEHITLTTDQQVALNKIKDQAVLAKSTSDRDIEKAEQELGTLTAADQPDVSKIDGKVREIAKMAADQRMAFIRSVGEAAKLLTPEQRKILTGFASPAPAASASPMSDHM